MSFIVVANAVEESFFALGKMLRSAQPDGAPFTPLEGAGHRHSHDADEVHLREQRCPAGRCAAPIEYRMNENCIGCTLCARAYPVGAIAYNPYEKYSIDTALCTRCDMCRKVCQDESIDVV